MRKHKKPRNLKKKEKRSKSIYLIGAIIVFLMVFSVVGYMAGRDEQSEFAYNDFNIAHNGKKYILDIDKIRFEFYSHPTQLESIEYNEIITNTIRDTPYIYLTFDPEMESLAFIDLIRLELGAELQLFKTVSANSILKESENYNLPIITCDNATQSIPVVQFIESEETRTTFENNCITLESNGQNFLMLKDLIIYKLLGVMQNG